MAKSVNKITEALSLLMEGFTELEGTVRDEPLDDEESEEEIGKEEEGLTEEQEAEIVNQVRSAMDDMMDSDDYSTEEVASMLTHLMEALQDIDPDVFDIEEVEDEDVEDDDMDFDESFDDLDEMEDVEELGDDDFDLEEDEDV